VRTTHVLVFALIVTAAVFVTTPLTPSNAGYDFDGMFYAAMAGSPRVKPALAHVAPWCYRVATPAVAARMPFDTLTSFRSLAFVANVASLVLLFLIARSLGFAGSLALVGVALYAGVFWTLKFSFYSPAYIDAQTQVLLLAIVYLTVESRFAPLVVVLAVAVLQKESLVAFSLFAVAALLRQRQQSSNTFVLAAALILAPVAALLTVRALVPAAQSLDTTEETLEQLRQLVTLGFWPIFIQSLFSGMGLLIVVLSIRPASWMSFVRERYEWVVYSIVALALLFGGRDKGRLFLYLLPAVIVCALVVIDNLRATAGARRALIWIAVLLALHAYLGNYLTPMGTFEEYLARLVPEHSEGRYLPYLARDLAVAGAFVMFTLAWVRADKSSQSCSE
jgi:hypothetical protein